MVSERCGRKRGECAIGAARNERERVMNTMMNSTLSMKMKMHNAWATAAWRVLTLVVVSVGLVAAREVKAQMPGDWNGDGRVTYTDAAGMSTCVTGLVSQSNSSCTSIYDTNGDMHVSLFDVIQLGDVALPTDGDTCSNWGGERYQSKGFFGYRIHYEPFLGSVFGIGTLIDPGQRPWTPFQCRQSVAGEISDAFTLAMCDIRYESDIRIYPDSGGSRFELFWIQAGIIRNRGTMVPNHVPPLFTLEGEATRYSFEHFDAYRSPSLFNHEYVLEVPMDRLITIRIRRLTDNGTIFRVIYAWVDNGGIARSTFRDVSLPSVPLVGSANAALCMVETNQIEDHASMSNSPLEFLFCEWSPGNSTSFIDLDLNAADRFDPKPAWVTVSQPFASSGASVPESFSVLDIRP